MVRARRWIAPCYALGLTVLIGAPLLRPGYLLLRDAVSTPRSYLTDAALGLGESAPRAVPQDFAVALASHVLDGGIVVKALLFAGLWLAGFGAARLVAAVLPDAGLPGQLVAVTVAIWNPYVAERLLQGHWSLLVGYGCLPWVAVAMLGLRSGPAEPLPGLFGLVFFLALAGLTPTGLLLAAVVALVCVAAPGSGPPRWWCAVSAVAIAATAALPWLMATVVGAGSAHGEAEGVAAFAARAEPGLGTLGSLAGLGGIWNADAVPGSRTTVFALLATVVLLSVVGLGWTTVRDLPTARPLLILAGATVLLLAVSATGAGLAILRWASDIAPGLGVLRDGQKWVALAMPGYALASAGAIAGLRDRLPPARAAAVCCLALVLVLPDLAWGVAGRLTPVHYPPGWAEVAAKINADPRPVAVLPADTLRRFDWAGPAPVLDPLPRWVRADVFATGDLSVGGRTVPGEGTRARAVQQALLAGAEPAALGVHRVGWVVKETSDGGESGSAEKTLKRLPVAYRDSALTLYRVGGRAPGQPPGPRRAVLAAHLLWLAMLVVGAGGSAVPWVRRRPV
ncbi:hypothetical protein MU0083_000166 [[Mycobacterium] kokjensenii]|uniref:Transmembrane protein n=1 Tax=[Mycobacterium] kokjensenii TaxID=3064287 RepID=A0ABN9MQN0_9MYCO|nr:hypothetical protein [Mycolicibacter sp. MU0083]CAJ1493137.1 hypothetical protein MU0083_000166 [Mycolicibacter sp. MU0083]